MCLYLVLTEPKKQLTEIQGLLERYCIVSQVFVLNYSKCDLILIKSHLLPILVNERDFEPTVNKKANQFISFKFDDSQLLDIMTSLGGATNLDSFLKAYKTSETKKFLEERFDHPNKMQNTDPPPYDAFHSELRSCNPLETGDRVNVNLLKTGLTTRQAVVKYNNQSHPLLGLRILKTCKKYGSKNK